jgi:ATP-dependent Clp protease ATP-binding subunit ClpA
MNDIEKMTVPAKQAMQKAAQLAEAAKNTSVEPEHLLYSLLSEPTHRVSDLLKTCGVEASALASAFKIA